MTPATSVTFYRPEFEEFLYALIGADRNEMPLSVLSALARVDVDPWEEAAELTELPKDAAARRLAFARLPGGHLAQAAPRASVDRLIELLPRRGSSKVPLPVKTGLRQMTGSSVFRQLRQVSTHCSLSDLCNWDVPGGTNCSHLKGHFAVLGPCIMRSSGGFGI